MKFGVTEILTWKRCRRRWGLSSENMSRLRPVRPNVALMSGGLMHKVLENWTNEFKAVNEAREADLLPVETEPIFAEQATKIITDFKKDYREHVGAAPSAAELDPIMDGVALIEDMFTNYVARYGKPIPKGWQLINIEQRVATDIPGTEHWECQDGHLYGTIPGVWTGYFENGKPVCTGCRTEVKWQCHQLRSTMDGLLRRIKNAKMYALENKTYAIHPNPYQIEVESQMTHYAWVLRQLFGPDAGGILYNGIWKRDGSNKKHKPEDLFFRQVFERSQAELDECGEQLAVVVMEMAAHVGLANDDPRLYTSRRWEGCTDCKDFDKLCRAISRREDVERIIATEYTLRTDENLSWAEAEEG